VLLVTGDADRGAIITPDIAEQARQLNPNLEVVHLAGAGHNIRRERSDAFGREVRDFLERHVAGRAQA
jgi:pimeloyl-ACP methyl ester carboxylesterase